MKVRARYAAWAWIWVSSLACAPATAPMGRAVDASEDRGMEAEGVMEATSVRYLALGDSYTIGESVEEAERWPVQLAARLNAEGVEVSAPEIIARTGWTTANLGAGLDAANPQGPYAMVSLLIGVNNQYQGRDIEAYRAELGMLIERSVSLASGERGRVFVVSIPDWGVTPFAEGRDRGAIAAELDRFNAVCREEAERAGLVHVDITPISRAADPEGVLVAGDGLHPSGEQYRRWVEAILPAARGALGR